MPLCTICIQCLWRPNKVSGVLELEFQMVDIPHVGRSLSAAPGTVTTWSQLVGPGRAIRQDQPGDGDRRREWARLRNWLLVRQLFIGGNKCYLNLGVSVITGWYQGAGNVLFAWKGIPGACWIWPNKERSLTHTLATGLWDVRLHVACILGHAVPEQGGNGPTPTSLNMGFGHTPISLLH